MICFIFLVINEMKFKNKIIRINLFIKIFFNIFFMLVLLYIYLVPIIYQVGKLAQWPYQDKTKKSLKQAEIFQKMASSIFCMLVSIGFIFLVIN